MGLTIHYGLGMSPATKTNTVIDRLDKLRDHALTHGLAEVSVMRAFEGKACDFESYRDEKHPDHDWMWFLIQASRQNATDIIGFRTWPGEGCEEANFGLCRAAGKAWKWHSFCKTQYASSPKCGGVANFLRCHLSVVSMLDEAKRLKLLRDVHDEGEFLVKRDVKALALEVGEWDEMIAAQAGVFKDLFGGGVESPILDRKDFEHLEARGVTRAENNKET